MKHVETTQTKQGHVSAPGPSPKDEELQSKTGSHLLDNLLETALDESLAAAYVCLRLSRAYDVLGDRIESFLESRIKPYRKGEFPDARSKVGDYLRVCNWLAYLSSVEKTIGGMVDNSNGELHQDSCPDKEEITDQIVEILKKGQRSEQESSTDTGSTGTLRERRIKEGLSGVFKAIDGIVVCDQKEVLTAALERVHGITDRASRLSNLKERVCDIYDRLDVKAKCAITVLQELFAVDGCSVGVDYGYELMNTMGRDNGFVLQAREELPDDQEVACLAEVYELSHFINQAV